MVEPVRAEQVASALRMQRDVHTVNEANMRAEHDKQLKALAAKLLQQEAHSKGLERDFDEVYERTRAAEKQAQCTPYFRARADVAEATAEAAQRNMKIAQGERTQMALLVAAAEKKQQAASLALANLVRENSDLVIKNKSRQLELAATKTECEALRTAAAAAAPAPTQDVAEFQEERAFWAKQHKEYRAEIKDLEARLAKASNTESDLHGELDAVSRDRDFLRKQVDELRHKEAFHQQQTQRQAHLHYDEKQHAAMQYENVQRHLERVHQQYARAEKERNIQMLRQQQQQKEHEAAAQLKVKVTMEEAIAKAKAEAKAEAEAEAEAEAKVKANEEAEKHRHRHRHQQRDRNEKEGEKENTYHDTRHHTKSTQRRSPQQQQNTPLLATPFYFASTFPDCLPLSTHRKRSRC